MSIIGPLTEDQMLVFNRNPSNANITFRIKSYTTIRCHLAGQAPEDALSFIEALLEMNPKKRLSGNEIFTHPYFNGMTGRRQLPEDAGVGEIFDMPVDAVQE